MEQVRRSKAGGKQDKEVKPSKVSIGSRKVSLSVCRHGLGPLGFDKTLFTRRVVTVHEHSEGSRHWHSAPRG